MAAPGERARDELVGIGANGSAWSENGIGNGSDRSKLHAPSPSGLPNGDAAPHHTRQTPHDGGELINFREADSGEPCATGPSKHSPNSGEELISARDDSLGASSGGVAGTVGAAREFSGAEPAADAARALVLATEPGDVDSRALKPAAPAATFPAFSPAGTQPSTAQSPPGCEPRHQRQEHLLPFSPRPATTQQPKSVSHNFRTAGVGTAFHEYRQPNVESPLVPPSTLTAGSTSPGDAKPQIFEVAASSKAAVLQARSIQDHGESAAGPIEARVEDSRPPAVLALGMDDQRAAKPPHESAENRDVRGATNPSASHHSPSRHTGLAAPTSQHLQRPSQLLNDSQRAPLVYNPATGWVRMSPTSLARATSSNQSLLQPETIQHIESNLLGRRESSHSGLTQAAGGIPDLSDEHQSSSRQIPSTSNRLFLDCSGSDNQNGGLTGMPSSTRSSGKRDVVSPSATQASAAARQRASITGQSSFVNVNPSHLQQYNCIRSFLSGRGGSDKRRMHRSVLKRSLRSVSGSKLRRLSVETGVPLERLRLALTKKVASESFAQSASVLIDLANDPPRSEAIGGNHCNGGGEELSPASTASQRRAAAAKEAMERYLAQSARPHSSAIPTNDRRKAEASVAPPLASSKAKEKRAKHGKGLKSATQMRLPASADPLRTDQRQANHERMDADIVLGASGIQQKLSKKRKADKDTEDDIPGTTMQNKKPRVQPVPQRDTELCRLEAETRESHLETLLPGRHDVAIRSFALRYNEWSVLAAARWAHQRVGAEGGDAGSKPLPLLLPTSPAHFRRCGTCGRYGHLEVACSLGLSSGAAACLRDEIDRGVAQADPVIEITEVCEGYAVEQCNKPLAVAEERRRRARRAASPPRPPQGVVVTELDHLAVHAAPSLELLLMPG